MPHHSSPRLDHCPEGLPRAAYLDAVIALQPNNAELRRRRDLLRAGGGDAASLESEADQAPALEPEGTTCGTSR